VFTGLSTPEDYFRVIKNHKWLIIVPIVLCVVLAGALYQLLPKTYRSQRTGLLRGTEGAARARCRCFRAGGSEAR
jgi:uncharacterized protein involved in exopolysaccharide biosynthesis